MVDIICHLHDYIKITRFLYKRMIQLR